MTVTIGGVWRASSPSWSFSPSPDGDTDLALGRGASEPGHCKSGAILPSGTGRAHPPRQWAEVETNLPPGTSVASCDVLRKQGYPEVGSPLVGLGAGRVSRTGVLWIQVGWAWSQVPFQGGPKSNTVSVAGMLLLVCLMLWAEMIKRQMQKVQVGSRLAWEALKGHDF